MPLRRVLAIALVASGTAWSPSWVLALLTTHSQPHPIAQGGDLQHEIPKRKLYGCKLDEQVVDD